jgi:hypothetical protein
MGKCGLDSSGSQVPLAGSWETSNEPWSYKKHGEFHEWLWNF